MNRAADDGKELGALIAAAGGGDRGAFRALYDATSAKLFGVVLRIVRDRDVAEDVLQETYLKVWRKAEIFDPAYGRPITWLAAIARNRAIDRVRASGARRWQAGDEDEDIMERLADPRQFDLGLRETLKVCLERLDAEGRDCVVLAYCLGLSREELAERFERPVGTIKTWLHRNLLALRRCLENG